MSNKLESNNANINKEIERKYLIEYPDLALLRDNSFSVKQITQTYLESERSVDRRARRSEEDGNVTYTFTEKRKITELSRFEDEHEISEEEYSAYLASADKDYLPISKTRYCIKTDASHIAEIDVYDGITNFAICEVELASENEPHSLPSCVKLIREVSGVREYTNRYIAKKK